MTELIIYGAGGMARELAWLAGTTDRHRVVAMIDDDARRHGIVNEVPVMDIETAARQFPDACYVIGVGGGRDRERLAARSASLGLSPGTVIHPGIECSRWLEIGAGTVICAGCILTTNIRIGTHVQINLGCTISHDVELGDFVTLAPGVHVTGHVRIEPGVTIGTGAVILPGQPGRALVVGENAVIGAGSVVTRNIAPGSTVVGMPARAR